MSTNQGKFTAPHPCRFARRTRGWRSGKLWPGLLLALMVPLLGHAESISKEYQLKAAFLYNFTKFVEWPTNRFATTNAPIVIGVLGPNPFGAELAKAVQDRTQNGREYVVTNLTDVAAGVDVHLLFVPRGQEERLDDQLPTLHAAGVLTVGETPTFAELSGIITFTMESDKIRFEIHLDEAERGRLKISSKLLQLAKVVRRKT